ncbi:MAG: hypothetical protein HN742_30415 [Lentisphaerae bacterium]|jgi:hypothetical protein|nr:hypothetical protein [Lentisphaerota bacterium]MBT5606572.1 hypothetical protein [Lentisphaerota bacterium]MBT7846226.1 hypothetical protein [Lentisphaerota bacterium]
MLPEIHKVSTAFLCAICALLLSTGCVSIAPPGPKAHLYVADTGDDTWSGRHPRAVTGGGPFASLQRAQTEVRRLKQAGALPPGGLIVQLESGQFELNEAFALTAEDSGMPAAPITYRAAPGAKVRLIGGRQITNFTQITDSAIVTRLDDNARETVVVSDLQDLGITDLGSVVGNSNRLELFFQDVPMTMARWPNEGFTRIVDLVGGAPHKIHGIPGDKIGAFTYKGDRPQRWMDEPEVWLHGYWFWDWADQRQRIENIDLERKTITLEPPYHGYGYRRNQWYYAQNVLAELDAPGEWYLDKRAGKLYFWPPSSLTEGKAIVSVIPSIVTTQGTSYVTFQGFTIEASRGTAMIIRGGTGMRVVGCTIRNTGGSAVSVGGTGNGVIGCDVYGTGSGGIHLSGGDRKTLNSAGLFAENNHVHHYARWKRVYQPGITLHGCGNRASRNLIDNAPHMGMGFGGNNHLIELNELHSVCYESNDAGAMYTGRDWAQRGTVIRNNYLHHINGFEGRGCVGVYLDDQFSGTEISGNLFYNVTRAAMIGGGRDCTIENNIFVNCVPATHVDSRGLGWAARGGDGLRKKLEKMPYTTPPWSVQYPSLVSILEDEPMAPKGNVIARNICIGGKWGSFGAKAKPLVTFTDNLLEEDPLFVDAEKLDFRLRKNSPAWALGFEPIPFGKIGVYDAPERASWPVASPVRPMIKRAAAPAHARKRAVVFTVPHTTRSPVIDGIIIPDEWSVTDPRRTMSVAQGLKGHKISPPSRAWLQWDTDALYVAIDNAINPKFPIQPGNTWGQDDAVELAFCNPGSGKDAPILVLRGFPSGHFESSDEAGALPLSVKRAAKGVRFQARQVSDKSWITEWRIPFRSLDIDPAKHRKIQFNLSVRKTADNQWVEWQGTGGSTWKVDNAGILEFGK